MNHQKIHTDDFIMDRGIQIASRCSLWGEASETFHHLIFSCKFLSHIWKWIMIKFQINNNPNSIIGWLDLSAVVTNPRRLLWFIVLRSSIFFSRFGKRGIIQSKI
ncbi:unnamed protein product [Vicia faba]|uniref:Reverse transcriptase zinc-binding domain-containing protein n=1 Tax=Vicia faba TaxID=3906 RepID=A0AAV0ZSW2_VICFA|nr:unnamed protein product [Vicia faba]